MARVRQNKPSREQLQQDMKKMNNAELAKHYGVSNATITNWIAGYGLWRTKPNQVPEEIRQKVEERKAALKAVKEESECDKQSEIDVEINENPSPEQIEQFFMDTEKPKDKHQEILDNIAANILILRKMYHDEAEKKFREKINELLNGGIKYAQ